MITATWTYRTSKLRDLKRRIPDAEWRKKFRIQAITLPVSGPVDGSWEDLRLVLKDTWRASTEIANAMMTEMIRADVVREANMEKLPKWQAPYLYPVASKRWPDFPRGSLSSILQAVRKKYAADRWEIVWLRSRSAPSYRYPYPFPVRGQDIALEMEDGEPIVAARIGDRRWRLRLRRGRDFGRQLSVFRKMVADEALPCEAQILERPGTAASRNGYGDRDPGGGPVRYSKVVAKLVAWVPREEVTLTDRQLIVRTLPGSFLVARQNGDAHNCWYRHDDHVRRWYAAHQRQLLRLRDDRKADQRGRGKWRAAGHVDELCRKHSNRIDSYTHEVSASLADLARRRRVGMVLYDDSDHSYLPKFQYTTLWTKLAYKLDAIGIRLQAVDEYRRELTTQKQSEEAEVDLANLSTILSDMLRKATP